MADKAPVRRRSRRVPEGGGSAGHAPEQRARETPADPARAASVPKSTEYPNARWLFTIDVLGYPVHVFLARELSGANIAESTGSLVEPLEIHLLQDLPSRMAEADAIIHELIHLSSTVALTEELRLTEHQVNTISTVLVDTIRRNPPLREYLKERLFDGTDTPEGG